MTLRICGLHDATHSASSGRGLDVMCYVLGARRFECLSVLSARGDVLMVMRELTITDVSVIAPTAPSHVRAAAVQFGAADKRYCTKRIKYRKRGRLESTFVPLSVETYGTLGQPFMTLLADLARRASPPGKGAADSQQRLLTAAFQEASVQLVRGNAMMMRCAVKKLNRASGKALREGLDVPVMRKSAIVSCSCV